LVNAAAAAAMAVVRSIARTCRAAACLRRSTPGEQKWNARFRVRQLRVGVLIPASPSHVACAYSIRCCHDAVNCKTCSGAPVDI